MQRSYYPRKTTIYCFNSIATMKKGFGLMNRLAYIEVQPDIFASCSLGRTIMLASCIRNRTVADDEAMKLTHEGHHSRDDHLCLTTALEHYCCYISAL